LEEKLLYQAFRDRGVAFERIDPRRVILDMNGTAWKDYGCVLVRCLSHSRAFYITRWLDRLAVPTVSSHRVVATCGDKMLTSAALRAAGVPIPRTVVALTPEAALQAIEDMGYPVVLKPLVGSWGRFLARVNDRDAAEAILEHKAAMEGYDPAVYYIQDYVDKPGRDIRTMVAGHDVVYGIYRRSDHWITNTARDGEAVLCELSPELVDLSQAAAQAVGGGIVTVDLLETRSGQLLVNEVNHTPEFHGAAQATDVDIGGRIVEYVTRTNTNSEDNA
jgi:[lysine-biosynthesis-protein LysW]--L-2-aminoadipate ligase